MGNGETTSEVIGGEWAGEDIRRAATFRQEYLNLMLWGVKVQGLIVHTMWGVYYCVVERVVSNFPL